MSRQSRLICSVLALIALAVSAGAVDARAATLAYTLSVPTAAQVDATTAIQINLPSSVAAVNGRIFFNANALELVGVAPSGAGTALSPVDIDGGAAFAAYGLKPAAGTNVLSLIVVPHVAGGMQVQVVIDAAANALGVRISGAQIGQPAAPAALSANAPTHAAGATRTLVGQRVITRMDLDTVTAAWQEAVASGSACAAQSAAADANGDGCVDVVDIQAVSAGIGQPAATNSAVPMVAPAAQLTSGQALAQVASPPRSTDSLKAAVTFSHTFTVTYAGDSADANAGDGQCADSQGRCSLRAAMTEANWSHGADLINFNIPGSAPIDISIGSVLPFLNDTSGGTTIDGYSQPGSKVNTAQFGSNAIPGIAIAGTGDQPQTNIFHITSANNVIRGFALYGAYRAIGLNTAAADNNQIIGNWFGVKGNGTPATYLAREDIYIDQGPSNNVIGTPALADRNVIGNAFKGIDQYGPGNVGNVIQNNLLCMTPSGAPNKCSTGIDHDFGAKSTQIGGFDANERNVIGPTLLNGIEISHGWDPNGNDTSDKWVNENIHVEGNWIGFRMDGSYDASYRSGSNKPSSNDGNGVNIYDGCSGNVVDGNFIGSVYDGINTMVSNCFDNVIENNTIGVSPAGQAAPLKWWGVHVRQGTYGTLIKNNVIRHAALGGIGLVTGNERTIEITRNIVSDTSGPAIHLEATSGSDAPGSNNLYASPVITATSTSSVSGTGIAGATVEVYQASRAAGQSGLPIAYLGTAAVAGNGTWTVPVSVSNNTQVTALEIAPNGNTSELAANVNVGSGGQVDKPAAKFVYLQESGSRTVDFTDTSTNSPTSWTWTFGDGSTSTTQNPSHTYAKAGKFTVKLTVTNSAGSSTKSKTITVAKPTAARTALADRR